MLRSRRVSEPSPRPDAPRPMTTQPSADAPRPGAAPPPDVNAREHEATRLLAMSFDAPVSPSISLRALAQPHDHAYGWGFAWYPEAGPSAMVIKDPTSIGENPMTKLLRDWERFQSTVFVCHLRGAARTLSEQDTHPFAHAWAGRSFVLAHNGDLAGDFAARLPLTDDAFAPIGRTDSERAFSWLLDRARAAGARRLADVGWDRLHGWFRELDALGTANFILTDGIDLAVYRDADAYNTLYSMRLAPPHAATLWSTPDIEVDLGDAEDRNRSAVLFSTIPLAPNATSEDGWVEMTASQMIVARRGSIIFDSHASVSSAGRIVAPPPVAPQSPLDGAVAPRAPAIVHARPDGRVMTVLHETIYRYEAPVERSSHLFRLQPTHDLGQELLEYSLELSAGGLRRTYEDVFGNHVVRAEIEAPYSELRITARSRVRILHSPAADLYAPARRVTIPLVWMPWQRQMMTPYLLPPELPETQLQELNEFAMSFVERQDGDLVQTLLDLNGAIYRDFQYVSGSTTISTTPYDVYASRKGVCQDFANLLICLARLLGIPARYRVGYIFTGGAGRYANQVQSDASHAWAELYLPWAGWTGFDPTNGILAGRDHVRVACGRNYRDATPTSGTLYKGGGGEKLGVTVKVEEDSSR
jgi:transglutaminase-like putative cysteine protease/predicted glutamine amidotransferase